MFKQRVNHDIYLRMLELRDALPLITLIGQSYAYLREWLPWLDETGTAQDAENFIRTGLNQYAANNGAQFGIWHHNELVGVLGLHDISWTNRSTSLGYWLGQSFQGRGIMTQSCRTLIDILFQDYDLNRIEIQVASANRKSRAIPERLGFQNEGYRRQAEWLYDHYVDHVIYGMLAQDWMNTSPKAPRTPCSE